MDSIDLAHKKEQLAAVTDLLESEGWMLLAAELERKRQEGIAAACNMKLTLSERDAACGTKAVAEYVLEFLPHLKRSLESTIKKTASSRKGRRE